VVRGSILVHMWRELHRAGIREAIRTQELHLHRGARITRAKAASPQDIITGVDIFRHLPDEAKEHLTRRMEGLHFAAGETIVEQGAQGDSLFIIVEGAVGVRVQVGDDEIIEVDRMGAGTFFGEMALLTGEARSASIRAITDTWVYEITKDHMAPLVEGNPEMSRILSEELTTRTVNREAKKSEYEASQIDEQALFAKFLGKIQSFFGVS
jgi:branched-chain amino acid transport system substrate-binding protein